MHVRTQSKKNPHNTHTHIHPQTKCQRISPWQLLHKVTNLKNENDSLQEELDHMATENTKLQSQIHIYKNELKSASTNASRYLWLFLIFCFFVFVCLFWVSFDL